MSNNMETITEFSKTFPPDEKVLTENSMDIHIEEFFNFLDERLIPSISEDTITAIKVYISKIDKAKNNSEGISKDLRKELSRQVLNCEALEESRSSLRGTIKKASANWSERKAQISECDCENSDCLNSPKEMLSDEEKVINYDQEHDMSVELKYKNEQLELSKRRTENLNKRLHDYDKVIGDQENIIHGLKEQLDTYFTDNLKMSKQLAELNKLFQEIEASNCQEVNTPNAANSTTDSTENIPSQEEYHTMTKSVSKTYIKLKELIYEKKSLVTEIERLKILNVELQLRVSQQENRLVNVSEALQATWLIVSNLKDEHAKIHTEESILRYELKGKREILHKLREELEWAREQWHIIRKMNSESEDEWTSLRKELDDRKNSDEITIDKNAAVEDRPTMSRECSFEPPIDLLLDMGIEYGVVDADDDEPATVIALIHGEDVHNERLRDLESQCCYLYQKLMTSTTRALALASRLTSLHEHYSMSDEDDDDEEQAEDDDLFEDNNNDIIYESSVASQDSESNDTAYVSEADGPESAEHSTSINNTEDSTLQNDAACYGSSPEDSCDVLSKRLINFLPKKIEILSHENKCLITKLQNIQDEKDKSEMSLKAALEFEVKQRRKLNDQLFHLGKCVDELKLERNGKIEKAEAELQRKIEEIDKEHKEHTQVIDELESLSENFKERGDILQLTAMQLGQAESRATTAEEALSKFKNELDHLQAEITQLKESRHGFNAESFTKYSSELHLNQPKSESNEKADISFGTTSKTIMLGEAQEVAASSSTQCNSMGLPKEIIYTPQVALSKDATFSLPFDLSPNTILHWTINVLLQEITFGITYVREVSNERTNTLSQNDPPVDDKRLSVDLISPVVIRAVDSPSNGRIIPKIHGHYCLTFKNLLSSSQQIKYQVWIQNANKKC